MSNEGPKTIVIKDAKAFLEHLSFWHNKTDDECIELAKDENGNLDAEQALINILERDFVTSYNEGVVQELLNQNENE